MVDIFCSNCGEKIKEGMQFCGECGAKVVGTVTEPEAVPAPQADSSGPATVGAPPAAAGTAPTKEEKNKLILFMVLSIILPIVGWVLGIIKYSKKDKKSGMHYVLCGLAGFTFGISTAFIDYVGWLVGLLLIGSVVYNGIRQINAGVISADF